METLILASLASFLLGGGIGALLNHTYHDYSTVASDIPNGGYALGITDPTPHVHQAVTQREDGWYCACGAHYHRFLFTTEDGLGKRCQCNEYAANEAQESRWQSR